MNEIYKAISNIFIRHMYLNKAAMKITQSIGLNGFKRMHECDTKTFLCWDLELSKALYDKYREKLTNDNETYNYTPNSIREHLATWDMQLETDIKALSELNKQHINMVGCTCKFIDEAMCLMLKRYEKTGRWYKRFEESSWSAHDIHSLDDYIHAKYKKLQGDN